MIAQLSHLSTARKHLHVHSKWHEPIKQLPVYQNRCPLKIAAKSANYRSPTNEAGMEQTEMRNPL